MIPKRLGFALLVLVPLFALGAGLAAGATPEAGAALDPGAGLAAATLPSLITTFDPLGMT